MLFLEYLSGQTVVAIKIGRNQMETLPAITLCFDNNFMYKKLAQIEPKLQEIHENYTNILDQFENVTIERPEQTYKFIDNMDKDLIIDFSVYFLEKNKSQDNLCRGFIEKFQHTTY